MRRPILMLLVIAMPAMAERPPECASPDAPLLTVGVVFEFFEEPGRTTAVVELDRNGRWLGSTLVTPLDTPRPEFARIDERSVPQASMDRLQAELAAARIGLVEDCRHAISPAGFLNFRIVWCGAGGRGNVIRAEDTSPLPRCSPELETILMDGAVNSGS